MVQLEAGPFLLPQEILEEIFQHLGVDAILSLRVASTLPLLSRDGLSF